MDIVKKSMDILRLQRHDYMNKLQVIYGLLQMKRYSEAEEYIIKILQENIEASEYRNLGDEFLTFCFEHLRNMSVNNGIKINLNIELNKLNNKIFEKDFDKKYNIVNNILIEFINLKSDMVYIDLFEDKNGINLLFSNTDNCENEIAQLISVQDSGLVDARIYKLESDDKLIYKLVFE